MFGATDTFDPAAMQQFMRQPDIFWSTRDALSPPPEVTDFTGHFVHPDVWTMAATWEGDPIGFVQFVKRGPILAEMTAGFHEEFRGRVALGFSRFAIGSVFEKKGILKIVAIVPSDNRPALAGIRRLGFAAEGRLTRAIVRNSNRWGPAGLYDLTLWGLSKPGMNGGL
jgi:RimJ/RimL family protein N-acetyltransferase